MRQEKEIIHYLEDLREILNNYCISVPEGTRDIIRVKIEVLEWVLGKEKGNE